jgi:hypothetical protein
MEFAILVWFFCNGCVCVFFFFLLLLLLVICFLGNAEDALSFVLFRATLDEGSRSRVQ